MLLVTQQVEALLERGAVVAAGRALERAALSDAPPDKLPMSEMLFARGLFRGAQGDRAGALEDLLACGERLVSTGSLSPAAFPGRSSAALAHLALGDRDEAQRLAAEEVALARAFEALRPLGIALRAAGLTEGGPSGLDLLREAVTVLEPSEARLELARALVDLGSAVRRAGRRSEARSLLRRGHDLARECGGLALAERAGVELPATGARPRGQLTTGVDALTPSERRVAAMAADGLSNPQIAQALFVSLKTVETHLGHAYQKLGVHSRSELPDELRAGSPE
jgi:DNA-binding CsgD family transcriptional regulator